MRDLAVSKQAVIQMVEVRALWKPRWRPWRRSAEQRRISNALRLAIDGAGQSGQMLVAMVWSKM